MLKIGFHFAEDSFVVKQTTLHGLRKQFHNSCQVVTFIYLRLYTLAYHNHCGYSDCSPNRAKLLHGLRSEEVVSWGGLTSCPAYNVEPVTNTSSSSCANNGRRTPRCARRLPPSVATLFFTVRDSYG